LRSRGANCITSAGINGKTPQKPSKKGEKTIVATVLTVWAMGEKPKFITFWERGKKIQQTRREIDKIWERKKENSPTKRKRVPGGRREVARLQKKASKTGKKRTGTV